MPAAPPPILTSSSSTNYRRPRSHHKPSSHGSPLGTPKLIAPQQPNPRHPTNHKLTALEAKWSGGAMEPEIVAFSPGATSTLCDDAPVEPRSFLIATGEGKPLKP